MTSVSEDDGLSHAEAAHRVDEFEPLDAHHLAAHQARDLRPGKKRDHADDARKAGAGERHDHGREDEARHHLEDFRDAHHEKIEEPAPIARGRPDHDPDDGRGERRREADGERDRDTVHDAGKHVATELVRAEEMGEARRLHHLIRDLQGIGARQEGRRSCDQHQHEHIGRGKHARAIGEEAPPHPTHGQAYAWRSPVVRTRGSRLA